MKLEPVFNKYGDLTKKSLMAIAKWEPDFSKSNIYGDFYDYLKACWNPDYGSIFESEADDGTKLICFSTGGWSANEAVQDAMNQNSLFKMFAWESSHRGGLSKYVAVISGERQEAVNDWDASIRAAAIEQAIKLGELTPSATSKSTG